VFGPFLGFGSSIPSIPKLSFSIGCSVLPLDFLGAGAFFCFLALGGLLERSDSSSTLGSGSEFSSSDAGMARFFVTGALRVFGMDCFVLGAALGFGAADAFFGTALGF